MHQTLKVWSEEPYTISDKLSLILSEIILEGKQQMIKNIVKQLFLLQQNGILQRDNFDLFDYQPSYSNAQGLKVIRKLWIFSKLQMLVTQSDEYLQSCQPLF